MEEPNKTYTKGELIVQDIKVGDIIYEFGYGIGIESKVITKPKWDGEGYAWKSEKVTDGKIINYYVSQEHSHYGPNLYDYKAYMGMKYI